MKRYLIPLALLAFSFAAAAQTMRTVNDTNELVMLNPRSINTNLFVHVMPPLKGSVWTWIAGDTTGPDTNHLDSVLYPGLGRWVWNNIGTNYFETLIVSNLVAGGDSLWTNLGGILQPQNLTLPVMLTNQLQFGPGTTNVISRSGSDGVYTNGASDVKWIVRNGGGASASLEAQGAGTALLTAAGTSPTAGLRAGTDQVGVGAGIFGPATDLSESSGAMDRSWTDNISSNSIVRGPYGPNATNYVRMNAHWSDADQAFVIDIQSLTNNTAGPGFGVIWKTNGVPFGGPSSGANWTAVGATDSSLAGTASANVVNGTNGVYAGDLTVQTNATIGGRLTTKTNTLTQCNGTAFAEFQNTNYSSKVSVGMLGHPEANLSFNMDYTDGVHRYYDPSLSAMWMAFADTGWQLQYAPTGQTADIWNNSGQRRLVYQSTNGHMVINTTAPLITAGTFDATLTLPKDAGYMSLSGTDSLVIEGASAKGTTGAIAMNQYNAGNMSLVGGGGTLMVGLTSAAAAKLEVGAIAGSNPAIRMTDQDVAHGMTALPFVPTIATDTTLQIGVAASTTGGATLIGLSSSASLGGLYFIGIVGSSSPTVAPVVFRGAKQNTTSYQAVANTEKLAEFQKQDATPLATVYGDGTLVINGNYKANLTVGSTTYIDANFRSQTNAVAGALTFSYCTNGVNGVDSTTVRWLFNSSGSDQTLTFPIINTGVNGWRTNVFSPVPPAITNNTIMKVILDVGGPTDTLARQTNCYVKFEYYQ